METAIEIIKAEIRWHIDNEGKSEHGEDYELAFIDGMKHIRDLLIKAKEVFNDN
jgi:hypothetical protein